MNMYVDVLTTSPLFELCVSMYENLMCALIQTLFTSDLWDSIVETTHFHLEFLVSHFLVVTIV